MRYIKEFYRFIKHIYNNKTLLITLIKNDFRKDYLGSYFGILWAFIQPISFMFVIWFVFQIGFRARPVEGNVPFFLWLIAAMIPWNFISSAIMSGMNSVVSYSFLVRKVAFRVSILPLVKIGSVLIIHFGLVLFLFFITLIYGFAVSIYWLEIVYYIFASVVLILGMSWFLSSLKVFVQDIGNFVGILLQFGFWLTPIFWNISIVPKKYQFIIKLNPFFYIIQGYRDSFIYHVWFWERWKISIYFWVVALLFFIVGAIVFKRLRPHFGDVL